MQQPTLIQRMFQVQRLAASEGMSHLVMRLRRRLAVALYPPGSGRINVRREDLVGAAKVAGSGWALPGAMMIQPGQPLSISWVCSPPSRGSGGHTTIFRMVAALERGGHDCTIYLNDPHGWSVEQHRRTIREVWPSVRAEVRDVAAGIEDCHALFATDWCSAYVTLASSAWGRRCYFVQDFEPLFSPAGTEYLLAEATYRFGYHGVTAGRWLAEMLAHGYGMTADSFDFGCDLSTYSLVDPKYSVAPRSGICYYCRPSTPRRCHELAVMSLDLFAEQHPDIDIHIFGEPAGRLPFRAIRHGLLTPGALNALYNQCVTGLVLSATNVSLVPLEMLAAGCIPVVNDADHNRAVLDSPAVKYAAATPFELAEALSALVRRSTDERELGASSAAHSVQGRSWENVGEKVERVIRRLVAEPDDSDQEVSSGRRGAAGRSGASSEYRSSPDSTWDFLRSGL